MHKYHINVFYSPPDEGFIADVPDLGACTAFGKTPQEAMKEIMAAIDRWLKMAEEEGIEIPVPTYKPAIYR